MVPTLEWDLTSNLPPRYIKRPFTTEELNKCPVEPAIAQMRLVIDYDLEWSFRVGDGQNILTLQQFFTAVASLMKSKRVPWEFWSSAGLEKKTQIARNRQKRTGKAQHMREFVYSSDSSLKVALDAYARVNAPDPQWTGFTVSDLLTDGPRFWGLVRSDHEGRPDEWVMKTTH